MSKLIDRTGKIYGFNKVLGRGPNQYHPNSNQYHITWMCQCLKCGKIRPVRASVLAEGYQSCCTHGRLKDKWYYSIEDNNLLIHSNYSKTIIYTDLEYLPIIDKLVDCDIYTCEDRGYIRAYIKYPSNTIVSLSSLLGFGHKHRINPNTYDFRRSNFKCAL